MTAMEFTRHGALLVPTGTLPAPNEPSEDDRPATADPAPEPAAPPQQPPARSSRAEQRRARRDADARAARDAVLAGETKKVQRWAARAAEARHLRRLLLDPDVQAVRLMRQRARWSVMAWSALVFALLFTMVNVQRFAAGHAEPWSPMWVVAWLVDPAFSILLVGLLIARGHLSAVMRQVTEPIVKRVEYGLLAATTAMNVAPELVHRFPGGLAEQVASIVLHLLVPLLAFAAASVITLIQDHFAAAIAALTTPPDGDRPTGINLHEHPDTDPAMVELSADDRKVLDAARHAIATGDLDPDPSGYAIYRRVMGGRGDKTRAYRIATAVNGWRPALHAA
ncbi:hypothetical protein E1211_05160 [Micromonospora sp. 15K316]|uniref:hypothetical protein n=1 Tax=Micromonospora sp. 15K316 TaxID=2530376 RepID=UPI00104E8997|nr:hypothetical protein [Micromonospora sp. 15K316]TDC39058.1 hypothetical protein E1211_05160 [Micromonospora sp. 15K316]